MQLTFSEAIALYQQLPTALQSPSHHPEYLRVDSLRCPSAKAIYFAYCAGGATYYHPFLWEPIPATEWADIQSAYGYGGPLATNDSASFLGEAHAAFASWCQENSVLAEFERFHPLLQNERYFFGDVIDDRMTVWIDLTVPDLLASYSTRARTAIRKAIKLGLTCRWCSPGEFRQIFPDLYRDTMQSLGADEFYLFKEDYFAQLTALENYCRPVLCYHKGEPVAGAMFLQGAEAVEYHLAAANSIGKALGATNLILHEAATSAQQCGKMRLHLGGGTDASPTNSLLFFKAGFSSQRAHFRIGRTIYQSAAYLDLKLRWEAVNGKVATRTLFYR